MAQNYRVLRRGRISFREQLRGNALSTVAQADPKRRQQLLDDPNVHDRVKQSLRSHMEWEQEQINRPAPQARAVRRPVDGKPAMPMERDIQKACLQFLRIHPKVACVWRQNSGTFTEQNRDGSQRYITAHTMPGLPDIVGFLRGGRALFCEIKRPGGKATPMQQAFIDRANAAGALAAVITSTEEIEELLR